MKLSQKETEVIETLRNISHENVDRIHSILLALMTNSLLNYSDGENVVIPYFGTFYIKYKGDKITNKGREAELDCFFDPSPYLRENIGAYEDFKKNKNKNISTIPIINHLETLNKQSLKMTLNDMELNNCEE